MNANTNEHGQEIGFDLSDWKGVQHPGHLGMEGQYGKLLSLDPLCHAQDLFDAYREDPTGKVWTYSHIGPFKMPQSMKQWVANVAAVDAQPYFAVIDKMSGQALGIVSFMRIQPDMGSIGIGDITFSPRLQRTRVATEAIYLLMKRAMGDLGYRRLEWKCDALNAPSHAAAERFGFSFDGLFKHAAVYKGRNCDTAWYSLLAEDWPAVDRGCQSWLRAENFDETGQQRQKLGDLISLECSTLSKQKASKCLA